MKDNFLSNCAAVILIALALIGALSIASPEIFDSFGAFFTPFYYHGALSTNLVVSKAPLILKQASMLHYLTYLPFVLLIIHFTQHGTWSKVSHTYFKIGSILLIIFNVGYLFFAIYNYKTIIDFINGFIYKYRNPSWELFVGYYAYAIYWFIFPALFSFTYFNYLVIKNYEYNVKSDLIGVGLFVILLVYPIIVGLFAGDPSMALIGLAIQLVIFGFYIWLNVNLIKSSNYKSLLKENW